MLSAMLNLKDLSHKILIVTLVVMPLACVFTAIFLLWNRFVFLEDIIVMLALYAVTAMGVTIGYHRLLTHQSFECGPVLKAILLIAGAMSFDGQPLAWAATHIKHHAHSDEDDDPHSPLKSFWHAHMGWLFEKKNFQDPKKYCPQLLEDPVVVWIDKYTLVWLGLSLLIPYLVGGMTGLLWGGGVRIFLVMHVTWSVNSICHTFGSRDFETTDESRNNWLVGLLAFGEGWHNNHHAFPKSAFHGMRWWQFDMSSATIWSLEKVGLVWNVHRVSEEVKEAKRNRNNNEILADLQKQLSEAMANARLKSAQLAQEKLSKEQYAQMVETHRYVTQRLEEIKENMSLSSNMKKQKIQEHLQEVKELAARVKQVKA